MAMMDSMMDSMISSMDKSEKSNMMRKMMPLMLKMISQAEIASLFQGIVSKMMFKVYKSKLDFYNTASKILEIGKQNDWRDPEITDHFRIEKELSLKDPNRVATVSMCCPERAHHILKENLTMAVMMPMQINVYEKDGEVYIAWLNIGMMSKMFGPKIHELMKSADDDLFRNLSEIIKTEED